MVNKQEAERIAASVNMLRPDWPKNLILAVLGDDRCIHRGYADLAIAMTCVAVDPTSQKPGRIHERGPWWNATLATMPAEPARVINDEDCAICYRPPELHSRLSWTDAHDYEPQHARAESAVPTEEQKAALEQARIDAERIRTEAHQPEPERELRDPAEVIAKHTTEGATP
jgi:hypothetical protein